MTVEWNNDFDKLMSLIDAGPDLLKALRGLYNHTKNNHQIHGLNEAARAAIERAERIPKRERGAWISYPDLAANPMLCVNVYRTINHSYANRYKATGQEIVDMVSNP